MHLEFFPFSIIIGSLSVYIAILIKHHRKTLFIDTCGHCASSKESVNGFDEYNVTFNSVALLCTHKHNDLLYWYCAFHIGNCNEYDEYHEQ